LKCFKKLKQLILKELRRLNAIIRNEKKDVGLEFIGEMSKTYRYTLKSKQDLVTVKEEIDFLQSYLLLL